MHPTSGTPDEPFNLRHNITAKELDLDLLNLNLPEAGLLIAGRG